MAKANKKMLGAGLAGVMSLGVVAGVGTQVVNAAESQAQQDAKAWITHTQNSINKWYAGIKNQVTWEGYIKKIEGYIQQMPVAERAQAEELTAQVEVLKNVVNAIASINHVEKSLTPKEEGGYGNFHGIKNVDQWKDYLDKAQKAMAGIDKSVFQAKYDELLERYNKVSGVVDEIEKAHYDALEEVEDLYQTAVKSLKLEDAEKALAEAKKLGTHKTSEEMVKKIEKLIENLNVKAEVETVSAADSKTIVIKGKGLHNIKAEDITVEKNSVESIKLNDDLTEMTVVLKDGLLPDYETSVKIKVDGTEKEYKVNNGIDVKNIEVIPGTFGHDRADQNIKIKVNGVEQTIDFLKAAGYDISFVAVKSNGSPANIFASTSGGGVSTTGSNKSATGIIRKGMALESDPGYAGLLEAEKGLVNATHKVEIQASKDGKVIVSGQADIKIINMGETSNVINDVQLVNIKPTWGSGTPAALDYNDSLSGATNAYKMSSTTLMSGEIALVHKVLTDINGTDTLVGKDNVQLSSSNNAVAYIDGKKIVASTAGTAQITVKVGSAERVINVTVKNEKRYLNKLSLDKSVVTIPMNSAGTGTVKPVIKVKTTDQNGDPIAIDNTTGWDNGNAKTIKAVIGKIGNIETIFSPYQTPGAGVASPSSTMICTDGANRGSKVIGEQDLEIDLNAGLTQQEKSVAVEFYSNYRNPSTNIMPANQRLATLTVKLTKDSAVKTAKFEVVNPKSITTVPAGSPSGNALNSEVDADEIDKYASDFKLDLSDKDRIRVVLPTFNSSGVDVGNGEFFDINDPATPPATAKFSYEIVDKSVVNDINDPETLASVKPITGNGTGTIVGTDKGKVLDLVAKAKGTTQIVIRDLSGTVVSTHTVTVVDNPVEIASVQFKAQLPTVTYNDNIVRLGDLIDTETSGNKDALVKGITLTNSSKADVRLTNSTLPANAPATYLKNELYLDINADGKFTQGLDKVIGHVYVDVSPSGTTIDAVMRAQIGNAAASYADELFKTPAKGAGGMEGTVIVRIIKGATPTGGQQEDLTKSVGSTQFKVDVLD